ncbi:ovarian cancer G-protein coupled receptor 1-like [Astyanax mexicanus]|uniref:Ovarian cancer G-protein coupled receptor 1-like n=1 Tax=Astyanax mexicanus TaxID=7994 RepID=A0A8T2LAS8_ASTMX|nr:ovarian cancer G-protein coupled receptor 1-like [Astyanax mexicanus]
MNETLCTFNDTVDASMYPTAYSLFFILGLPGNCLSLYVAWILMRRGNSLAVYLVNLSVSDLLYTISLPVWIILAQKQPVDDTLCSLIDVIMFNSFYVGSGLLCCISMDRYLAVVFPLYFNSVHKVRTAALVSLESMSRKQAHVAIIRVVLGFLIPVLLMAFCFQQIIMSLRASTSTLASERRKIRNLLLLLLLVYLVSFAPFQIVMFLRGLLEPDSCSAARRLRDYYMVFVATTTINSVADPVVYCLLSESAKTELKRGRFHRVKRARLEVRGLKTTGCIYRMTDSEKAFSFQNVVIFTPSLNSNYM